MSARSPYGTHNHRQNCHTVHMTVVHCRYQTRPATTKATAAYIGADTHRPAQEKGACTLRLRHALWTPVRINQYTQAVLEVKPIKSFGTTSHEHRHILGSCPRGSMPKQASAQTALIMKQKTKTKSAASRKRKKHVLTMVRRKAPTRPEHKFQVSTQGVTK